MNKKFLKKCFVLLLTIVSVSLVSCSNESKQRINIKPEKLEFTEGVSSSMSVEFATIFYDVTSLYIEWYNTSVKDPESEESKVLKDNIDESVLNDMQSILKGGLMNEYEKEVYKKCLDLGMDMQMIRFQNIAIRKEELLREKNLKELSDTEFDEAKNDRKQKLIEIKESIIDILEKYYDY